MFTRLNRALNALSVTIQKAGRTISSGVGRLTGAAQRDVNRGADLEAKRLELDDAILTVKQEFEDQADVIEQAILEEQDDEDKLHEAEDLPEWILDAEDQYPGADFDFDVMPGGNCDGNYHTHGPYGDLAQAVDYLEQVPVPRGVFSTDDGFSFFTWICDNS